ncbi:MAG: VWA domain-containing protein [Thermoflexales bacterium]|nr:VWA domain-containing protein [Thermoflexales bacterium]
MTNQRSVIVFVIIVLVALCIVGLGFAWRFMSGVELPTFTTGGTAPPPANAIVVEFHSSNTKQDWVNAVIERFNAEGHKTSGGHVIVVEATHVGSGSSMTSILEGESRPTVWSPGSAPWVDQVNQKWQDRSGKKLIAQDCPPTTSEPIGIAMWEPMARALGWPDSPVGWRDLAALSAAPDGWAARGHPEWGDFKFGHGHPDHSNSGLLSMIAEVYASAGVRTGLTPELVKSQAVMDNVAAVEQRVYHYGRTDTDLLTKMTQRGPAYLHAVTTYEVNVIKWNMEHATELQFPLVMIYPADGTFWVGNPYCLVDAEWVTPEQREAAELFGTYLLSPEQQARAIAFGLRPASSRVALQSPIDLAHGAVPAITMSTVPDLDYPAEDVIGHILDVFHQVKKKTTIILALDVSGSMRGDKIKAALEGAVAFLDQMSPDDQIVVYTFSRQVVELQPQGPVGETREQLRQTIQGLYAEGGTALHQVMIDTLERVSREQAADQAAGHNRLYAIVLLSDGKNEIAEGPTENDLLARLPAGDQPSNVKIYAIAYGNDANKDLLATLANRTNGKSFSSDPSNIREVYFLISSEF